MGNNLFTYIKRIVRFFAVFIVPGGAILLAAFLATRYSLLTPWTPRIEKVAPYIILLTGMILGWRFHRSRLAFVILILFLSERSLFYFGTDGSLSFGQELNILYSNAILLPMNMALFYLVKDRGIFNVRGLLRLIFIALQFLGVFLLLHYRPDLFQYVHHPLIQHPALDKLPLPQTVIAVFGLIAMIFLVSSLSGKGDPLVRGFFWALVAAAMALLSINESESGTLYYSCGGLIIIFSVIETAYAMAFQDELTNLPARRALNTTLHGLGKKYAIAMLDIDFFKKFNDTYGHDVGDQVLCMVASHLKRVGGGGKPYRYGGEEFTIVFPGKSREEAIPHLERVRESIEEAQFALRGRDRPKKQPKKRRKSQPSPRTVSVTISIGVASPARNRDTPSAIVKAADQALYRAKKKGRNCVAV